MIAVIIRHPDLVFVLKKPHQINEFLHCQRLIMISHHRFSGFDLSYQIISSRSLACRIDDACNQANFGLYPCNHAGQLHVQFLSNTRHIAGQMAFIIFRQYKVHVANSRIKGRYIEDKPCRFKVNAGQAGRPGENEQQFVEH